MLEIVKKVGIIDFLRGNNNIFDFKLVDGIYLFMFGEKYL